MVWKHTCCLCSPHLFAKLLNALPPTLVLNMMHCLLLFCIFLPVSEKEDYKQNDEYNIQRVDGIWIKMTANLTEKEAWVYWCNDTGRVDGKVNAPPSNAKAVRRQQFTLVSVIGIDDLNGEGSVRDVRCAEIK